MIYKIIIMTLGMEVGTIISRLMLGSAKKMYKKHNLRLRIHHGYVGLLLMALHFCFTNEWLLPIGAGLFLSDAIHHFIVLPLWVGRTEL